MAAGDQHRLKAAEFRARAQSETRPHIRVQFEDLAKAHLRLAGQADLNDRVDVIDDLCREMGAMSAKSKRGFYRPRSNIILETEQRTVLSEIARGIPLAVALLALAVLAFIVFS